MADDKLNIETINEFELITQYPLTFFFINFKSFIDKDYSNIISYYSGDINSLNNTSFNNLKNLKEDIENIFSIFSLNKNTFSNYKWWLLIDQIEKIDSSLQLIDNTSKWLRSTISKGNFNPNPEVDIPFKQGQTLESIERDVLGSEDWLNTWSSLAIKNDLREEDYTPEAGFLIKANFDYTFNNFRISSIVDNPIGDRILGLDLNKKLQFVDNDLLALTPKETFYQNAYILINLRQYDNPEFFKQGIEPTLIVGSNVNSLTYPVLFRQITALFKADDTIKAFTIININRVQDSVSIEFQIESRLGDIENISLTA
jgi:hypothetical protein